MGKFGKISRLLSPLFGAFFTMASIGKDEETGPGQLEIGEMVELYEKLGEKSSYNVNTNSKEQNLKGE